MNKKMVYHIKLLSIFVMLFYMVFNICSPCLGKLRKYGYTLSRERNIKNGFDSNSELEKVVLYSQKSENSDEHIIRHGLLVKRDNAKATVLFCHGFSCEKHDIGFLRYIFKDFNCMTFDFRAHGENIDGQYCTLGKNEAFDVIAAAKFLRSHPDLKDKPLLVYAFSMGAVASIEAQAKDSSLFDAMILDCPFDSAENVIKRGLDNKRLSIFGYEFSIPGRRILTKYVFHPYVQSFVKAFLKAVAKLSTKDINTVICPLHPSESIKKVSVPCLFIHCKNDEKISVDNIKSVYYNAASNYKKLWITNGRNHFDSYFYNPEQYTSNVRKFAYKVINGIIFRKYKHKITEDVPVQQHAYNYPDEQIKTTLDMGQVTATSTYNNDKSGDKSGGKEL